MIGTWIVFWKCKSSILYHAAYGTVVGNVNLLVAYVFMSFHTEISRFYLDICSVLSFWLILLFHDIWIPFLCQLCFWVEWSPTRCLHVHCLDWCWLYPIIHMWWALERWDTWHVWPLALSKRVLFLLSKLDHFVLAVHFIRSWTKTTV